MATKNNIYNSWLKSAPTQLNSGLTIIKKIKNKNDYVVLLGGNNYKGIKKFEMFGGKYDDSDKTALQTGIREFIEELFNIKLKTNKIEELVEHLINNNHILHNLTQITKTSASYFANFKTLELIYNYINYDKYYLVEPLDFPNFIIERNKNFEIYEKSNGLY